MNANQMKHAARLEDWKHQITECRASGLTVKEWCAQNGCNTSTYYRWERELFRRIKKPAPEETSLIVGTKAMQETSKQELVEVPVSEEAAPAIEEPAFRPVAMVRVGGMELSLTNAIAPELVRHLKELLAYAE